MLGISVRYKTRVYVHGLFAAMIGGMASSISVILIDPTDFNIFQGGFLKLGAVGLTSALTSAMIYLKEHPLPDPEKDIDSVSAMKQKIDDIKLSGTGN